VKFFFTSAVSSSLWAASPSPQAEVDVRRDASVEVIQQVMPCVVNVNTESLVDSKVPVNDGFFQFYASVQELKPSLGSGVIIDEDGYMLTNLHVVSRARSIKVKLSDEAGGGEYDVEPIFLGTLNRDVALLKIIPKKKGEKFKAIKFAKDDDLLLGETVLALGNPYGLGESVSHGILSSKRRAKPKENQEMVKENWLQTDASINPGNSGGPLINLKGELIGVNVAMLTGAQGIGFAIPIKEVRDAIAEIFTPETNARWFGARLRPSAPPFIISEIQAGGPAEKADLRVGDSILQLNGKTPASFIELNRWLRDETESKFTLTIQRENNRREVNVRLIPFQEVVESIRQKTGVDVQELTPELANSFGLKRDAGLLIARVEKGSPAEAAKLQREFLITKIDGHPVANILSAAAILSSRKEKQPVEFEILAPELRGNFILGYRQGTTTFKLR